MKKIKLNSSQRLLVNKIIGLVFISAALFILSFNLQNLKPINQKNSKDPIVISKELLSNQNQNNIPTRIVLPSVNIDLPINSSKIVNGYWELSETTASYGLGSGIPGTNSNTVIFAHAREGLFYNLKDVKVNDTIYVLTNNKWYRYKVNKITAVFPNQVDVIRPTKNEVLTLYTCTGFADEKRLIVQAIPQR